MSYTTQEVEAAVAKLVKTEIRRQYGALGNRRTDLQFNDIKDASAGVFILFSNAPFYVVKLAASCLDESLVTEQNLITNFIDTVRAIGRNVRPVDNLSTLSNARVALDALAVATANRDTSLTGIENVSAFQRFELNTQRFLDDNRDAVVSAGDVVQTPAQARGELGNLFRDLQTAHEDVIRRARLLKEAVDDFNSMELPSLLSQSIIEKSRDVLDGHIEQLEALTPQDRLGVLRDVTLDVLATRSTVRGFGSISAPTTFVILSGNGMVYTDSTHLTTPAKLVSDKYGPYTVVDESPASGGGIELDFTLDGDTSPTATIQLIGSFVAKIEGVIKGPYDIDDPNGLGLKTDLISIGLKNWSAQGAFDLATISLLADPIKEVYDLAKDINDELTTAFPTMPLFAEPYANPLKFNGGVDISLTTTVGTDADLIARPDGSVNFTSLGVEAGDWVRVVDPTSANYGVGIEAFGAVFEVESIFTTTTTDDSLAVIQKTALVLVEEISDPIGPPIIATKAVEVGGGTLALRLRISQLASEPGGDYRADAVDERVTIFIPESTGAVPKQTQFDGLTTIGLFPLMEAPSRPTTALDISNGVTQNFAAAVGQIVRVSAKAVFSATVVTCFGRTDPFSFLRAILYKQRDFSTDIRIASGAGGGLVTEFILSTSALSTVAIGDVVVIRTHTTAAQIGNWGVITAVSGFKVTATMLVASVEDGGREVEIGPDLRPSTGTPLNPTLRVSGGALNDGDYGVLNHGLVADSFIPLELDLDRTFIFSVGVGNKPVELGTVQLGQFRVDFSSTDETLETAITIDSTSSQTAVDKFFNAATQSDVGETLFFVLPEFPNSLEEGDTLELYTTQFDAPSFSSTITGLESLLNVIEIEDALPTDTATFVFSTSSALPFTRIRKLNLNNYSVFNINLNSWLGLATSGSLYFPNLQRLLNPLAVNTNPTIFQVDDPITELEQLATDLVTLSGYLDGYEAQTVEQVDTLIDTFTEKGADRAVNLLLEAQFSTFFGLDIDELSYSGTLQKSIRETERNDLPVRKTKRLNQNVAADMLIAAYEEPDFEFDRTDVEPFEDPSIPGAGHTPT